MVYLFLSSPFILSFSLIIYFWPLSHYSCLSLSLYLFLSLHLYIFLSFSLLICLSLSAFLSNCLSVSFYLSSTSPLCFPFLILFLFHSLYIHFSNLTLIKSNSSCIHLASFLLSLNGQMPSRQTHYLSYQLTYIIIKN